MDPSSTIPMKTEPRDSNTTPSSRKNRHSSIPQILIHPPPESKRQPYNPFPDLCRTSEMNYSPRRPRHQYYDPHYLNTFQTKRDEMRRQLRELEVEEWEEREEKERREKEEKEKEEKEKEEEKKERRQFSQAREGEQRVAGGAKRKEGRDYELARKRLGKLFSDSRRIVA
ncbi:MAG: hypothetical protein Q9215_006409 [Flavoplaca cf. flavocitrina]